MFRFVQCKYRNALRLIIDNELAYVPLRLPLGKLLRLLRSFFSDLIGSFHLSILRRSVHSKI